MSAWYIDALDPRAGLAFASHREPDLFRMWLDDTAPTAFFAPPYFVPEFVGARSTALAFARGPAQLGLLRYGKEEIPFDSIEAVAEFVRRVYLRGSGGNGPDEDGVPPLPGSPEEGGTGEDRFEEAGGGLDGEGLSGFSGSDGRSPEVQGVDPVGKLAGFALALRDLQVDLGQSAKTEQIRLDMLTAGPDARSVTDRLVRAAVSLLAELGRTGHSLPSGEAVVRWERSALRLVSLLNRVGLRQVLYRHPLVSATVGSWPSWARERLYGPWDGWPYSIFLSPDPYEDLCHLAVPQRLAASGGVLRGSPSLRALLQTSLATPVDRLSEPVFGEARAELVLLAACYLNVGSDPVPPAWDMDRFLSGNVLADLSGRAQAWISANLPQRVFSPEVEELIVLADRISV